MLHSRGKLHTLREHVSVLCRVQLVHSGRLVIMYSPAWLHHGRLPSRQQPLLQLRPTRLTATAVCCDTPFFEISQSVCNTTPFSMSTICCYVLRIHWRTTRKQISKEGVKELLLGEEKTPTCETWGQAQVRSISTWKHPWRPTTTMPTLCSLNNDFESSQFMSETGYTWCIHNNLEILLVQHV